ncbi:hypothetical protein ACHAW5_000475 [Stephanodiscus triporus]|uniref:Uncharacterized protein n=1 Tax=Stephanodiscus triporus TaxID=2934178 RepID=A0ABD3NAF4_9STRA
MIEGVVMGKIAVDVGDAFQRKMDRIVVMEQRVQQMDERRQQHHELTGESTRGDDHAKRDDDRTSPPRSDSDIASDFRGGGTQGIASPPNRKSLSALGSVFSPIRSRAERGEMGESTKVNASKKSPQCQGTPRTITTSSCSRSSGSSGSDYCDDDGRTRDMRTIVVADGNAMAFRPTAHRRQNNHLRPYHCIPPIVANKNPPRHPPPLISSEVLPLSGGVGSPSPPPPLISFATRPFPSAGSGGGSSSCSGGGWSSTTTESAATASPSPARVVASPRVVAATVMAGAASTRRARHEQQWHRPRRDRGAATSSEGGGGDDDSYRRVTRNREPSNVVVLGSESPAESMKNESKYEVNGRDNDASAAFTSSRDGAATTAAGGVGRDQGTMEGGGMLPPRNGTQIDRRRSGIVVKDRQVMECSGGSATTNRTSFVSKDVAVACRNEKGVVTGNILLSASSLTTTTTTTTAAHHTFDTVAVIKREGGTATVVHLPILIRPESLSFNKRQPTCWQMTRHRMSKTRGEF